MRGLVKEAPHLLRGPGRAVGGSARVQEGTVLKQSEGEIGPGRGAQGVACERGEGGWGVHGKKGGEKRG